MQVHSVLNATVLSTVGPNTAVLSAAGLQAAQAKTQAEQVHTICLQLCVCNFVHSATVYALQLYDLQMCPATVRSETLCVHSVCSWADRCAASP